jgi:hypothetical protein
VVNSVQCVWCGAIIRAVCAGSRYETLENYIYVSFGSLESLGERIIEIILTYEQQSKSEDR